MSVETGKESVLSSLFFSFLHAVKKEMRIKSRKSLMVVVLPKLKLLFNNVIGNHFQNFTLIRNPQSRVGNNDVLILKPFLQCLPANHPVQQQLFSETALPLCHTPYYTNEW